MSGRRRDCQASNVDAATRQGEMVARAAPRALCRSDIATITEVFRLGARIAVATGFDGSTLIGYNAAGYTNYPDWQRAA